MENALCTRSKPVHHPVPNPRSASAPPPDPAAADKPTTPNPVNPNTQSKTPSEIPSPSTVTRLKKQLKPFAPIIHRYLIGLLLPWMARGEHDYANTPGCVQLLWSSYPIFFRYSHVKQAKKQGCKHLKLRSIIISFHQNFESWWTWSSNPWWRHESPGLTNLISNHQSTSLKSERSVPWSPWRVPDPGIWISHVHGDLVSGQKKPDLPLSSFWSWAFFRHLSVATGGGGALGFWWWWNWVCGAGASGGGRVPDGVPWLPLSTPSTSLAFISISSLLSLFSVLVLSVLVQLALQAVRTLL